MQKLGGGPVLWGKGESGAGRSWNRKEGLTGKHTRPVGHSPWFYSALETTAVPGFYYTAHTLSFSSLPQCSQACSSESKSVLFKFRDPGQSSGNRLLLESPRLAGFRKAPFASGGFYTVEELLQSIPICGAVWHSTENKDKKTMAPLSLVSLP